MKPIGKLNWKQVSLNIDQHNSGLRTHHYRITLFLPITVLEDRLVDGEVTMKFRQRLLNKTKELLIQENIGVGRWDDLELTVFPPHLAVCTAYANELTITDWETFQEKLTARDADFIASL